MNLMLCSWLVLLVARGAVLFPRLNWWDKMIGDYSYPIYLMHWQVGFIASWWFFGEPFNEFSARGFMNFLVSCALLVPVSWIALRLVDHPIQLVRQRVKPAVTAPA